jgi:16S rRNA (cytidine1402-2'-O)-methyltransferase
MTGRLIMCATPIGNLGDVSLRLTAALESADVVFAEDTRRSSILLRELGVDRPMRSYFAGNEMHRAEELTRRLRDGETVVLLTDAGTPGVSDPGYSAIHAAVRAGAEIGLVPGPSAVTAALSVAGLPADRFVFEGFLPRRGGERTGRLEDLAHEPRTIVLFCSPNRLLADLGDLAGALGDERLLTVGRELTKLHEEVWRGTLAEAVVYWTDTPPRGEFVLVIAGSPVVAPSIESLVGVVAEAQSKGIALSQAVRQVAEDAGVKRRLLYEAVLRSRAGA